MLGNFMGWLGGMRRASRAVERHGAESGGKPPEASGDANMAVGDGERADLETRHAKLKAELDEFNRRARANDALVDAKREDFGHRMQRALSWVEAAAKNRQDLDLRFLCLWIAFNAIYSDSETFRAEKPPEPEAFQRFFEKIVQSDSAKRVKAAPWGELSKPVESLMENPFVFTPFWSHQKGSRKHANWKNLLNEEKIAFNAAKDSGDIAGVLGYIFARLYDARNQIAHGHATWNRGRNRDQLSAGADILEFLVPIFIGVMMNKWYEDWGKTHYTPKA